MKISRYIFLLLLLSISTLLTSSNESFFANKILSFLKIPETFSLTSGEDKIIYDTIKVKRHLKIGNDTAINKFYHKLDKLKKEQSDSLVIFHIGDSHIKGKFFTGEIENHFMEDFYGIRYHSYGLNGASFRTLSKNTEYLNYIEKIKPDLVIISLGTNDASGDTLIEDIFLKTVDEVIYSIREKYPLTEILLTTPPDYIKKGDINRNIPLLNKFLIKYCEENFIAYWDLYEAMGGEGSAEKWIEEGLMAKDKIHFTKEGYEKQAEMFYQDLMNFEYQ